METKNTTATASGIKIKMFNIHRLLRKFYVQKSKHWLTLDFSTSFVAVFYFLSTRDSLSLSSHRRPLDQKLLDRDLEAAITLSLLNSVSENRVQSTATKGLLSSDLYYVLENYFKFV